jgi:hypothetical protein
MGVEVLGAGGEMNGFGDTFAATVRANKENSDILLNLADGKHKNAQRPVYDPDHADNAWPKMVYSANPAKPELSVGKSLKGVVDPRDRKRIEDDNQAAMKAAIAQGFRSQPYPKPQIAVLDPAAEKMELKRKNDELQGQITTLTEQFQKLQEALTPAAKT